MPLSPPSSWLPSARPVSIGRRAAQAFLVLFCMTREGALCPKPGSLQRSLPADVVVGFLGRRGLRLGPVGPAFA
jgi:hypothetical protein